MQHLNKKPRKATWNLHLFLLLLESVALISTDTCSPRRSSELDGLNSSAEIGELS